jgi:hypothetical protein
MYYKLWSLNQATYFGGDEKWLSSVEATHVLNDIVALLAATTKIVEVRYIDYFIGILLIILYFMKKPIEILLDYLSKCFLPYNLQIWCRS